MKELVYQLKQVNFSFGAKNLFAIENLSVYQNERIAIVGDNGSGKSTLLKILAGVLEPSSGQIQRLTDSNYYPQIDQVTECQDQLDWELLAKFQVPDHQISTLSGGENAKLRLTEIFSVYVPTLLLDEPTTHLDQASIAKLIQELNYYYGTLVFVSHDRFFIDQVASKIWEVKHGRITEYPGNYNDYLSQKAAEQLRAENELASYHREKQQLEKALINKQAQSEKMAKVSAKQKKRNIRPDRLSSSKQKDTAQKNVQKSAKVIAGKLERLIEAPKIAKQTNLIFPVVKGQLLHNPYPVMGEHFNLVAGDKQILREADFQFENGKKIGVLGGNGAGKTTFLKSIEAGDDSLIISPKVMISSYQQLAYQIDSTESLLGYLQKQSDYPEKFIRSLLNNLGFNQAEVTKSMKVLSGGEATRIALALVFLRPANVLILDEPTNFIDLNTITALQKLIKSFPGMVLFTSHDQKFVEAVADQCYLIEAQQLKKLT